MPKHIPPYKNTKLPFEERAADLVSLMTVEEKVAQLFHEAPAIERLNIPAYNWWNECLHGVARAGIATVFPQVIGLAASFNAELLANAGGVISDEARAKHHKALKKGKSEKYYGLTFWTPNINIFRDPRWGRGQETYGEDPYLTSRLAVAFIKALQGNDKKYLKIAACAKHFAVHSGPDKARHSFDAKVSEKDLWETYLPAFSAAVIESGVEAVMGAYNRVNGEACCASRRLIKEILRGKWEFKGHFVSDCAAIEDIHKNHAMTKTPEEGAAIAINTGCDLNCCLSQCGDSLRSMKRAIALNMVDEKTVDTALKRLYTTRFRLGMFDPRSKVRYTQIPDKIIDSPEHRELALTASRESMVLLHNNGMLPLRRDRIKSMAVIGPNADNLESLLGNYNGKPSSPVTLLNGIKEGAENKTEINYAKGCEITGDSKQGFDEAIKAAEKSDIIILCMGQSPEIEGEECDVEGEREGLEFPGVQNELIREIKKLGKTTVLIILTGSAMSFENDFDAVLCAWYPGQDGGTAVASVLFGEYNPAGRLPVTFYKDIKGLPPYEDYSMENRTYRYFKGDVLYPFGYGLSYTKFIYSDLFIENDKVKEGEPLRLTVDVKNDGEIDGDEVVQVYIRDVEASCRVPLKQLAGFKRVNLKIGQKKTVTFSIEPKQLMLINEKGEMVFEPGMFEIFVGGTQPGYEQLSSTTQVLKSGFELVV